MKAFTFYCFYDDFKVVYGIMDIQAIIKREVDKNG